MLFVQNGINKSYTYNSKGELLSGYVNGNTLNYLYDSNSNRVQKESINLENIKQNRYLNNDFEIENQKTLDGSGNILTQTKTNKYIFIGNEKISTIEKIEDNENIVYNISDHLGGGSVDINNAGTILQKSDYYLYGGSRVLERSDNYKNNYLFTGKELDEETNLQYFEVRYYNPDFGRFYGQDRVFWELGNTKRGLQVLQDPQQLNSYSYARNNPIIYVDPSGEIAIDVGTGTPIDTAVQAYALAVITIGTYLGEVVSDHIIDNIIEYNANKKEVKSKNEKVQSSSVSVGGTPGGGGKKPGKEEKTNKVTTNYGEINLTKHAIERMSQRNISINQIKNTINNGESFNYIKNGETLKGFYDSGSKIFIGKGKNGITTVINKVSNNYINNLKLLGK